jgi:hypothetical protein
VQQFTGIDADDRGIVTTALNGCLFVRQDIPLETSEFDEIVIYVNTTCESNSLARFAILFHDRSTWILAFFSPGFDPPHADASRPRVMQFSPNVFI